MLISRNYNDQRNVLAKIWNYLYTSLGVRRPYK